MGQMMKRIFMNRCVHILNCFPFLYLLFNTRRINFQINIPEINARGPLWRYFSKINIDALVEITRWKKEQPKDESSTTFSDIRKRFGHHRKSIKNRMKNFYHRSNSDTQETCRINSIEHNELGSQGASCSSPSESDGKTTPEEKIQNKIGEQPENIIFRKRERHLFGSMLKKSRTSLCLEETAPRKKLIMAIGNGGGLKKKFNRSFEDKVRREFFNYIICSSLIFLCFLIFYFNYRIRSAIASSTINCK